MRSSMPLVVEVWYGSVAWPGAPHGGGSIRRAPGRTVHSTPVSTERTRRGPNRHV